MSLKKINSFLFVFLAFFLVNSNVKAAAILEFYASKNYATVGDYIVITAKTNDPLGNFTISNSNSTVLKSTGDTSGDLPTPGSVFQIRFLANSVGTSTLTFKPIDMTSYDTLQPYKSTSSITITVKPKPVVVLSNDNALSSLAVDGYTLTPEFNRDTLEYKVELVPETTKINVVANPNHGGASISGAGERDVIDGDNRLEIVVTAENGAQRTYIINANVKEYDPVIVKVNNKDYTVIRKKSSLTAPANYQEATIMIGENEVPAFKSDVTNLTLIGLKDEAGTPNLYVKENDTYTLYKEYNFNKVVLYPIEYNDYPTNYKKVEITYNDEKITAYKTKASSNYALIYGMNVETGEKNIYMYDSKEDTLQIYNREEIEILEEKNTLYLKTIIGLSTLSFVLLITTIVASISRSKKKKQKEENLESSL